MPKITKQFTLEIQPERYVNACSADEIYELWLLLSSPKYQSMIRAKDMPDKSVEKPVNKPVELPFAGTDFAKAWAEWKVYKKKEHGFKFKSAISENKSLYRLRIISGHNEQRAIAIINRSIENGWSGLFALPVGKTSAPAKTQRKNFG